jgi:hypothetical protein
VYIHPHVTDAVHRADRATEIKADEREEASHEMFGAFCSHGHTAARLYDAPAVKYIDQCTQTNF